MLTYAQIDPQLEGYGICAHPPKDRKRGLTFNYLISSDQVLSIFSLNIRASPVSVLWKTALPCKPCYIHSLAMTDKYVVFIRNVSILGLLAHKLDQDTQIRIERDVIFWTGADP